MFNQITEKIRKKIAESWLSILVVFMLAGTSLTKVVVDRKKTNEFFELYGIEVHLSTLVLSLVYAIILYEFIRLWKNVGYFLIILSIFLIGLLFNFQIIGNQELAGRIFFASKFVFLFMAVPVFRNMSKYQLINAENILVFFGKFNLILIIIGLIFGIEILKSYPYSERFGYNGLIVLQGMGSFIYNLLIIRSYYRFINLRGSIYELLMFVIASLLLGTKAVLLLLFLLVFYHFFFVQKRKIVKIWVAFSTLLSLLMIRPILDVYVKIFPFGEELINRYGYMTFLTSKRTLNIEKTMNYVQTNWNWDDYLFGNINPKAYLVESSIPDLFFFFGIAGLLVFIFFFKQMYFSVFENTHIKVLLAIFLVTAMLAGGFFYSVFNVIIFVLVFEVFASCINFSK